MDQNCDSFVSDELLVEIGGSRENGEIDENELRTRIKEAIIRIQKMIEGT